MKISNQKLLWIATAEAHSFIAFGVVLASFIQRFLPFWLPPTALIVIAIFKESLFDPRTEENQPFLYAGVTDLFFYVVGTLAGLLFLRLT